MATVLPPTPATLWTRLASSHLPRVTGGIAPAVDTYDGPRFTELAGPVATFSSDLNTRNGSPFFVVRVDGLNGAPVAIPTGSRVGGATTAYYCYYGGEHAHSSIPGAFYLHLATATAEGLWLGEFTRYVKAGTAHGGVFASSYPGADSASWRVKWLDDSDGGAFYAFYHTELDSADEPDYATKQATRIARSTDGVTWADLDEGTYGLFPVSVPIAEQLEGYGRNIAGYLTPYDMAEFGGTGFALVGAHKGPDARVYAKWTADDPRGPWTLERDLIGEAWHVGLPLRWESSRGQAFRFDGETWGAFLWQEESVYSNDPRSGRLVLCRLSDDLRRVITPVYPLTVGATLVGNVPETNRTSNMRDVSVYREVADGVERVLIMADYKDRDANSSGVETYLRAWVLDSEAASPTAVTPALATDADGYPADPSDDVTTTVYSLAGASAPAGVTVIEGTADWSGPDLELSLSGSLRAEVALAAIADLHAYSRVEFIVLGLRQSQSQSLGLYLGLFDGSANAAEGFHFGHDGTLAERTHGTIHYRGSEVFSSTDRYKLTERDTFESIRPIALQSKDVGIGVDLARGVVYYGLPELTPDGWRIAQPEDVETVTIPASPWAVRPRVVAAAGTDPENTITSSDFFRVEAMILRTVG